MSNQVGFSVYLSHFKEYGDQISQQVNKGDWIFTSLHIPEEKDIHYVDTLNKMLRQLKDLGAYIIADVSAFTLKTLKQRTLAELLRNFPIDNLRLDYDFCVSDLIGIPTNIDITLNASTQFLNIEQWVQFHKIYGHKLFAMHNFYPRVETGLDVEFVRQLNDIYHQNGIEVMGFIAGDEMRRGPIYEGLPTLEICRYWAPIHAFRLMEELKCDRIFVGDGKLSSFQSRSIESYCQHELLHIPAQIAPEYAFLYDKKLQIRYDTPKNILRLNGLRNDLATELTQPFRNLQPRKIGNITLDNIMYGRYSGEVQIIGDALPPDEKVNIIGHIAPDYLSLFQLNNRGKRIQFVDMSEHKTR